MHFLIAIVCSHHNLFLCRAHGNRDQLEDLTAHIVSSTAVTVIGND